MSHTNRNFIIAYIFLVGLPILGLVAVLKSGRSLAAPFSVDGTWKIEPGSNRSLALNCGDFLSAIADAPLSISQSGKTLEVRLNGGARTSVGVLEGKSFNASFSGAGNSNPANCGDRPLILTATLDPQAEPRALSGKLSIDSCDACARLEFRAVRQSHSGARDTH